MDDVKKKKLRSGYSTGACAAAAAKAATLLLISMSTNKAVGTSGRSPLHKVEIPFPDGSRIKFRVQGSGIGIQGKTAWASIIKDAGDDPDVTHRAEIVAEAKIQKTEHRTQNSDSPIAPSPVTGEGQGEGDLQIRIKGGGGVGTVTKPGLPVPLGEPAINPVPRKMIKEAVTEAFSQGSGVRDQDFMLEITIRVPDGEELAKKTLNHRLGIVGGISILGTTGIVKPVSTEAWTATISSSMDVASAMGHNEIVLSAGRTSEKAHMDMYRLSEESYALMGDYLEYSLREAKKHGFKKIHLCAQWAKMLKIAMATPQTHVRFGAINIKKAVEFLNSLGINISRNQDFNTAREIFDNINSAIRNPQSAFLKVCNTAKKYAEQIADGIPVMTYLVSYEREIIGTSE
jgi:cobalt-precorrin-5B (C1)-methyltransferase